MNIGKLQNLSTLHDGSLNGLEHFSVRNTSIISWFHYTAKDITGESSDHLKSTPKTGKAGLGSTDVSKKTKRQIF